ncbi:MAG: SurA N-terminal domain-containing protein [Patescibacteria group bacterium]
MENNKTSGGGFKVISLIVVLVAVILIIVFLMPQTKNVVAEVNGAQITQSDLDKKVVKTKDFLKGNGNTDVLTAQQEIDLKKNVLEGMITEKLVADYATENNIAVTNAELEVEFAKVVTSAGGEAGLETQLKNFNITKAQLNEDIRSALIFNKSVEKYVGAEKLLVTEAEALDTYNTLVKEAKAEVPPSTEAIPSFEDAKVLLMEQLRGQKINVESQSFVEFLRGKATIKNLL